MAALQDYLKGVENSGLKPGDWVRVTRTCEDHEAGWDNVWPKCGKVGDVGRIIDVDLGAGFSVEFGEPVNDWWGLPYFVLEKVEAPKDGRADTDFNVGDYVRIARKPEPGSIDSLYWNDKEMDQNVGKVGCVISVVGKLGKPVHVRGGNNDARSYKGFSYPISCLEKIKKPDDWTCPQEAFASGNPSVRDLIGATAGKRNKTLEATKKTFATEDEALAYAATLALLDKGQRVLVPDLGKGELKPAILTGQYDRDGDPKFLYYDPETKTLKQGVVELQFIHLPD